MGKSSSKKSRSVVSPPANKKKTVQGGKAEETPGMEGTKRFVQLAASVGARLIHLGVIWLIMMGLIKLASHSQSKYNSINEHGALKKQQGVDDTLLIDGYRIPKKLVSDMSDYPNPLGITDEMRKMFHPVVLFPTVQVEEGSSTSSASKNTKNVPNYQILDYTTASATTQLASEERWKSRTPSPKPESPNYSIGRYDENRVHMYSSELFQDTSNQIEGYSGARTVHTGIDLEGPVGMEVYAFTDGTIFAAGYNPERGDYGHVIVVEHELENDKKVWALYGHLDTGSVKGKQKGQPVHRGEVIGRLGDVFENGGWLVPHVHFQLATHPPETHDMPGAVTLADRPRALIDYPDPRLVLGSLY